MDQTLHPHLEVVLLRRHWDLEIMVLRQDLVALEETHQLDLAVKIHKIIHLEEDSSVKIIWLRKVHYSYHIKLRLILVLLVHNNKSHLINLKNVKRICHINFQILFLT